MRKAINRGRTRVIDVDLRAYFDNVKHDILLAKVARRVSDPDVMRLLKLTLKATGRQGVPQGGVISPLLSNIYLTDVDRMLERAKEVTRQADGYTPLEYARFADDLVILVGSQPRNDWLVTAVNRRLREELGKLRVEVNEEMSRVVDLVKGETFGYLGFDFRRLRSLAGKWRAYLTPKLKKRTELLRTLKEVFRSQRSQPARRVIETINPMLRGWVNYFRPWNSARCFTFVRDWVEQKVRRHLSRNSKRKGFGWRRWSRQWLYGQLGLFNEYRVMNVAPGRKRCRPDRSHNPWCEACRKAVCGKSARTV